VDLSGRWVGKLTQINSPLECPLAMTLTQNGDQVTGTVNIEAPAAAGKAHAEMELRGSVSGQMLQFEETSFRLNVSTKAVQWVLIKGSLTVSEAGNTTILQGSWEPVQPVCRGGQVQLRKQ
jgi:hypothetical protein